MDCIAIIILLSLLAILKLFRLSQTLRIPKRSQDCNPPRLRGSPKHFTKRTFTKAGHIKVGKNRYQFLLLFIIIVTKHARSGCPQKALRNWTCRCFFAETSKHTEKLSDKGVMNITMHFKMFSKIVLFEKTYLQIVQQFMNLKVKLSWSFNKQVQNTLKLNMLMTFHKKLNLITNQVWLPENIL